MQAAATWLMENREWDFLAVYFDAPDHAGHDFMEYRAPRMRHVSKADFALYQHVVDGIYCFQDLMLGGMVELAGADATIIVVSDHGFHRRPPAAYRTRHIQRRDRNAVASRQRHPLYGGTGHPPR